VRVTFLGTGVAVPYGNKAQSSLLIEYDDKKILIDCGIGSYHRLEQLGVELGELDAICITHHHLDHNGDLFNILKARWLLGCSTIKIFGPAGTKSFLESMLEAYPYLRGKLKFEIKEEREFNLEGLRFKTIPTIHSIESQGYVIDNAVAVSGDTRAFKEFISQECEVMVHELSLPFGYTADYHTTPENLKSNLDYCRADRIYLTHLYPAAHAVKDKIVEFLDYSTIVAEDMMSFEL